MLSARELAILKQIKRLIAQIPEDDDSVDSPKSISFSGSDQNIAGKPEGVEVSPGMPIREATPSFSDSSSRKRRGQPGDPRLRQAIRNEKEKHDEEWRNHLHEIFSALHSLDVPMGRFRNIFIQHEDGTRLPVSNWTDLDMADGVDRKRMIERLRKY
jgi:hypothetical protein